MSPFNRHIALPRYGVKEAIFDGDIADLAGVRVVEKDPETHLVNLSTIGFDGRLCAMASCDARYQSRSLYAMYARPELAEKIKLMLAILPLHLGIAVYEAFRPVSLQQTYFIAKAVELGKEYPSWSDDRLYRETSKWVAPFLDGCIPPHCTGGAIDLVLFDVATKTLVDMGKFGVLWGENPIAATLSKGLSDAQKRHRTLLMHAAVFAGLSNYGKEYWHVAYGDQMWGALNDRRAVFGPVKNEAYDPDIHTICHDKPALMKRIRDTMQSGL
ncbi:hypothetical protein EBZ35_02605 [bacterium]|nr:hypothetical protein [bacterium]